MSDFENVQGVRRPRLADLAEHVADAFVLRLAPEETYQPGRVALDAFEFMPYALTGLSAALAPVDAGAVRSAGLVTIPIFDETGRSDAAEQRVTVLGPGDVLGVYRSQIVRRYPMPGTTTAEDTFFAHIEFDRPELPWAFSAQPRGRRMTSWLALVVLESRFAQFSPGSPGRPEIVRTRRGELQPLSETWAWAHAQVHAAGVGGAVPLSIRASTAYGPANLSRIVCPRILDANTAYTACLVPSTDVGVRAGLGLPGGSLAPGWDAGGPDDEVVLPVYDRWEFRTGPDGDFATLARRLHGAAAPWSVGRRIIDTAQPGTPLAPLQPDEAGRRQVLRCALSSPAPRPDWAPPDTPWTAERTTSLRNELDRPSALSGRDPNSPGAEAVPDLPIIGPRIYASYPRGVDRLGDASDWFGTLNLDPMARIVAGLGTRVVGKDREQLMQSAWAQVGAVDAANRALQLAQLGRHVSQAVHTRLKLVDEGRLLQITRPLHERVTLAGNTLTLAGQTVRSATAPAALSGAFRRTTRSTGPLGARLSGAERATLRSTVGAVGGGLRDFTRPYLEPDGIGSLSPAAVQSIRPEAAAVALGLPSELAMTRVNQAAASLNAGPTLASVLTAPAAWGAAEANLNLGQLTAQHVTDLLTQLAPHNPEANPVAARSYGGLLAGLASSHLAGTEAANAGAMPLLNGIQRVIEAGGVGGAVIPGGGGFVLPGGGAAPGGGGVFVLPGGGALPGGGVLRGGGAVMPGAAGAVQAGALPSVAGVGAGGRALAATPVVNVGSPANVAARDLNVVGLSDVAAGAVLGPIIRPGPVANAPVGAGVPIGAVVADGQVIGVGGVVGAGAVVSDQERLAAFVTNEGNQLAFRLSVVSQVSVDTFRSALVRLMGDGGALDLNRTPPRPPLAAPKDTILTRLDPSRTVVEAVRGRLGQPAWLPADWFGDTLIRPIMAAPHFDRPMYEGLDDYNRDWLVPGLGLLPADDLITALETNDQFVEAFLIGLSDEMGRELLWRSYPTDARGTYFRRFWDAHRDELETPIHQFGGGALGSHVGIGPVHTSGRLVIVIRGEIVRRYPDMIVQCLLQQGTDDQQRPLLPETGADLVGHSADQLFTAFLSPDVMLVGFDITADRVLKEDGWWFVVGEHPSATRFNRPVGAVGFASSGGLSDGGAVAADRLSQPTRVAFAAHDFVAPPPPP